MLLNRDSLSSRFPRHVVFIIHNIPKKLFLREDKFCPPPPWIRMFGTFQQLTKGIFLSSKYPNVFKRQLLRNFLSVVLDPYLLLSTARGPSQGPNLAFEKLPLWKLHIWEVATWEKTFGKVPNISLIVWN